MLQQFSESGLCFLTTSERQVLVAESLCSLLSLPTQTAIEMEQNLTLSHSSDGIGVTVSSGDKGCVDVSPACWLATALSATIR